MDAAAVVAFLRPGDDGPPWDVPAQRSSLRPDGIPVVAVRLGGYAAEHAAAAAYQREWFRQMRDEVAGGVPLAVVNADAPHELLRTMGTPYVVNQWWASVCSARQLGPEYLGVLTARGYPDDIEPYSALALGPVLGDDVTDPPWGGLPAADILLAELTTDATAKIFEVWGHEQGAAVHIVESTVAPLVPRRWFDAIHDDWERVIDTGRIDLTVAQFSDLIHRLEAETGREFDEAAFGDVMRLANEHAEWNRRTRDVLARTVPAPIDVNNSIPATMIPQWHRGTEWGIAMRRDGSTTK